MRAFITVIGKDKAGIIYKITSVLFQNNINILDINQTLIEGYFTMIMLVDLSKMNTDFTSVKKALENEAGEIGVDIKIQREDIFISMQEI